MQPNVRMHRLPLATTSAFWELRSHQVERPPRADAPLASAQFAAVSATTVSAVGVGAEVTLKRCRKRSRRLLEIRSQRQQDIQLPSQAAMENGVPEPFWHTAKSSAASVHDAISAVLHDWRSNVSGAVLQELQRQWNAKTSSQVCPAQFEDVSKVWHDWRAGGFGDLTLAEVVAAQDVNVPGLREAFMLLPDDADQHFPGWRSHLKWEMPGRPPPNENWKAAMRRGAVSAELRRAAVTLQGSQEVRDKRRSIEPGFALAFVPHRFASELEEISDQLEQGLFWTGAPLVAVLSQGSDLIVGTAMLPSSCSGSVHRSSPRAFWLGQEELDEAGAEGYRLQEQLSDNLARNHYTEYYRKHGRTNGTVVACRGMLQRTADDVGSMILFVDPSSSPQFPRQALNLLDACFPNAVKAGTVIAASTEAPGLSIAMRGTRGHSRRSDVLALLLPWRAESAIGLCGCKPFGPLWEVFDADTTAGASVVQRISDPATTERDDDGRRIAHPAGFALAREAEHAGLPTEASNLWLGLPRGPLRTARNRAPGVGEWALYRGKQITAEGSLLLEGAGPEAEGIGDLAVLGGKALSRVQGFHTCTDYGALGRVQDSHAIERLASQLQCSGTQSASRPWLTLVFGGGEGARLSLADEGLHGGVCLGGAVLGAPGNALSEVSEEDSVRDWSIDGPPPQRATLIHRQAAGLFMLYSE